MLATHNCQLYVGAEDDRVIATIMVGHEGHRGWLYKLAVLPEFRGKGYGRDLVQQAERWLVARGVPKVQPDDPRHQHQGARVLPAPRLRGRRRAP